MDAGAQPKKDCVSHTNPADEQAGRQAGIAGSRKEGGGTCGNTYTDADKQARTSRPFLDENSVDEALYIRDEVLHAVEEGHAAPVGDEQGGWVVDWFERFATNAFLAQPRATDHYIVILCDVQQQALARRRGETNDVTPLFHF